MSPEEVQALVNFIGTDGFPMTNLSSNDWKWEASLTKANITNGIRVAKFADGRLILKIAAGLSAVLCQDRRVVSGIPYPTLPEFAYLNHARPFDGEITLEVSIAALKVTANEHDAAIWRNINHEAWKRAKAPSVFELMSLYAHRHLAQAEGLPAITFQAYRTNEVPEAFEDQHMVSATITIFGMLDDSIEAERWSGLARMHSGEWYLERLYLSRKCRRAPDEYRWTSSPCG